MEIAEVYEKILHENDGKCSMIHKLAAETRICKKSVQKAILFYVFGMVPSPRWRLSHGKVMMMVVMATVAMMILIRPCDVSKLTTLEIPHPPTSSTSTTTMFHLFHQYHSINHIIKSTSSDFCGPSARKFTIELL